MPEAIPTRPFGGTGLNVSAIGFGAWAIGGGGYGPVSDADAAAAVHAYLDAGGNLIDTARGYGTSEQTIGRVLAERPGDADRVFLATKTPNGHTAESIASIRGDVETSLRLLGRDYFDLLQLHSPPEDTDVMSRALDTIETLRDEGKVSWVGASVKGPNVTAQTAALCRQYVKTGRVAALQVIYSVLRPGLEEAIERARANGVAMIARTVLESGMLAGAYRVGHAFAEGDHRRRWSAQKRDAMLRAAESVREIADELGTSPTSLATRFALSHKGVSTVILGAKSAEQVRRNVSVDVSPLDEATLRRLSALRLNEVANPTG